MSWISQADWRAAEPDPLGPSAAGIIAHMNADRADALVLCRDGVGASTDGAAEAPEEDGRQLLVAGRSSFLLPPGISVFGCGLQWIQRFAISATINAESNAFFSSRSLCAFA
jgi:hypothetical protein